MCSPHTPPCLARLTDDLLTLAALPRLPWSRCLDFEWVSVRCANTQVNTQLRAVTRQFHFDSGLPGNAQKSIFPPFNPELPACPLLFRFVPCAVNDVLRVSFGRILTWPGSCVLEHLNLNWRRADLMALF